MKRCFAIIVALVLLVALCSTVVSCGRSKTANPIDFGAKYIDYEDSSSYKDYNVYYVFNADHTGYKECHYISETYLYTVSGRVEFIWQETSDGAIYLFKTEEQYNEDHTEGYDISFPKGAIYFGEDFFTLRQAQSTSVYVKEGTDLAKTYED